MHFPACVPAAATGSCTRFCTKPMRKAFAQAQCMCIGMLRWAVRDSQRCRPLTSRSAARFRREAMQAKNGIPADQLPVTRWRKSQASNPSGCCVEVAELPGGAIAVRNSRDPSGPALVYTRAEIGAFLTGTKNGEFDDLYPGASASLPSGRSSGGLTRWRRGARSASGWPRTLARDRCRPGQRGAVWRLHTEMPGLVYTFLAHALASSCGLALASWAGGDGRWSARSGS